MSDPHPPRPREILLVEDNPADCSLLREALGETGLEHRLDVCCDGLEAMQRLGDRDRRRPDLILLDLNMPRMDGREFLAARQRDPRLLEIPVIVMTTSGAEGDVDASYRLKANAYVTKAESYEELEATARRIADFWIAVAELPPQAEPTA